MSYDAAAIRQLSALTSDFYARESASFSATRLAPWHGWEETWQLIATREPALARRAADAASAPLAVLDLGCGNLRFERFLAEHTGAPARAIAIDNCPKLATLGGNLPSRITVKFQTLDIVESLLGGTLADRLPRAECDLAVAFGLMHHLPTFDLRARLLERLLGSVRHGGFAVVSFWQFLNDSRLAAKAEATTIEGRAERGLPPFQENDFLLGWQKAQHVYRFCHHTDDSEIDVLLTALQANSDAPPFHEATRFSADGKQGNLNRYVVLQRA